MQIVIFLFVLKRNFVNIQKLKLGYNTIYRNISSVANGNIKLTLKCYFKFLKEFSFLFNKIIKNYT